MESLADVGYDVFGFRAYCVYFLSNTRCRCCRRRRRRRAVDAQQQYREIYFLIYHAILLTLACFSDVYLNKSYSKPLITVY